MLTKLQKWILDITYLDYRSLSLFRILLGIVGVYRFTLALRWSEDFLAPDGFLPIVSLNIWATRWSVFFLNHTLFWAQALCLFGLVLSLLLITGYKSRTVVCLLWLVTLGLSARTHLIENNGHSVFRLMALWAIFLPLDRHFLLFNRHENKKLINKNYKFSGFPATVFFIQFLYIYFFAGITKNDSTWAFNGVAVYSSLNLGAFVKPLGISISENHQLTRYLTSFTTIAEMVMPFLLLADTKRISLRLLAVVFFIVLQIGFFATLEVGIFPFAMIAYTFAFLPSSFWRYFYKDNMKTVIAVHAKRTTTFSMKNILLSCLLLLATFDVLSSSFTPKILKIPNWLQESIFFVRIDQRWWMFVVPEWRDFWIDVEATREDGSVIDAWSWYRKAKDVSFSIVRPTDIRDLFSEQPWNNYLHNLKDNSTLGEWFLYNLCRRYNGDNETNKIKQLKLHYSYRTIQDFEKFSNVSHEVIKEWDCK